MDVVVGLTKIFLDPVGLVYGVIVVFVTIVVLRRVYKF